MRLPALIALALLLSGCTQNDPGAGDGDGFFTTCPSWIKYPHNGQIIDGALLFNNQTTHPDFERWDFMEPNATRPGQGIGDGHLLAFDGHPLDQIVFNFHFRQKGPDQPARALYVEDSALTLRFYASDGGYPGDPLGAYDEDEGPDSTKHEWVFRSDPTAGFALHNITLRLELAPADQDPAPSGVFLHWEMTPDLDHDIDTQSVALMRYSPEFWYRTCSNDGTKV
ncbi:MAG: hypothetical protein AABY18_01310 [Candidatus Thermoplasmatota archaeon]